MIKVTFWKEEKYVKFFEKIEDADGNIILKPYFEFRYKGRRIRSGDKFCPQVKDVVNNEFE
jgi:hypothetical protein